MDTVLANIVFFMEEDIIYVQRIPNKTESKQVQNGPYFIPELI